MSFRIYLINLNILIFFKEKNIEKMIIFIYINFNIKIIIEHINLDLY